MEALDNITNEDKDTYLTDVLYDELQKLYNKTEYTRFLVITDGVDNKEIGYTKEELSDYLKDNTYPIYSIGCTYKNNEEQLKNLFALSRLTKAEYFLLDDYEEYGEIVDSLLTPVTCVEIKVPDELKDGSTRNALITFEDEGGKVEISEELLMPFRLRQEEPVTEPTASMSEEVTSEAEIISELSVESTVEPETTVEASAGAEGGIDWISIGAAAVIVIALIVFFIINRKKKNNNKEQKEILPMGDEDSTVMTGAVENADATVFLSNRNRMGYIVVLRDNQASEKVFKYPLSDKVVIGRKYGGDVNIVLNYEGTISARHCEIFMRGNRFYVRDLHSSNGTLVNGKKVEEEAEMEFISGSEIKLGNLKLTIEIEQSGQ